MECAGDHGAIRRRLSLVSLGLVTLIVPSRYSRTGPASATVLEDYVDQAN